MLLENKREKSMNSGNLNNKLGYLLTIIVVFLAGCATTKDQSASTKEQNKTTAVDVAIARTGNLSSNLNYTGSTRPIQEVSVRSQVEGRLLNLAVDIGDRVQKGQRLGQIDDSILATQVLEQKAQLAALETELSRARIQVNNARLEVERLKIENQQAKNDAARLTLLAREGAIPKQQAEVAVTNAKTSGQAILIALEEIRIEEKAAANILNRIAAQKSVLAQQQRKQSFAQIVSPITGVVIEKVSQPGDLITAGGEIIKLGDFRQIKVIIPVSELEIEQIRSGKSVNIKLDAFPNKTFTGYVSRISPIAQSVTRNVPVEIIIDNPEQQINGGLLARVSFSNSNSKQVIVPESALSEESGKTVIYRVQTNEQESSSEVVQQTVQVGQRNNGKVAILEGIKPGERFVVKSSKPLKDGEQVNLSILSE
ncbi:efflux RND transporter periplasmic adaptor subunit [Aphanothece hegewaldii]|nr:efflux RND transporter periplasmic adaptor subunit [Aphanothece hegewaldii]